ncbi:MAG: hypothetical protein AB9836_06135 [Aminipila sp.]
MSELTNRAIAHITDQMMQDQNNPAIVFIEEHLTNICTTEAVANKLLTEGKSLKKALNQIKEVARKRQVGGCGFVPPDEGLSLVEQYYDIEEEDKQAIKAYKPVAPVIDFSEFL